ncbi:MAG: hypothetical protein RMK18_12185, partial [Armatimonadota bacterium]|nr:hypothetical protein [Armatimonadota bacterium]
MVAKILSLGRLLLALFSLCTLVQSANIESKILFASQSPDDFKSWFIWDTVAGRPGLVVRFDLAQHFGKPACTVEDASLSHDPRFASPVFEIPQNQWLQINATVSSDEPHYFFTLTF